MRPEVFALADRDRIYVLTNARPNRGSRFPAMSDSIPAGGLMVAWDIRAAKLAWSEPARIPSNFLMLDYFRDSPVLTFGVREHVATRETRNWNLDLLMLDKKTGRRVLEWNDPSSPDFRSLELNMAERYIELRSYSQRVRVIAVDRQSASAQ